MYGRERRGQGRIDRQQDVPREIARVQEKIRIGEKFQWVRRHSQRVCFGFQVEHDWHSMGELRLMQLILLQMQRHRTIATERTSKWEWVRAIAHTGWEPRQQKNIPHSAIVSMTGKLKLHWISIGLSMEKEIKRTNARASKRVYCDNVQIMEWVSPTGRQRVQTLSDFSKHFYNRRSEAKAEASRLKLWREEYPARAPMTMANNRYLRLINCLHTES